MLSSIIQSSYLLKTNKQINNPNKKLKQQTPLPPVRLIRGLRHFFRLWVKKLILCLRVQQKQNVCEDPDYRRKPAWTLCLFGAISRPWVHPNSKLCKQDVKFYYLLNNLLVFTGCIPANHFPSCMNTSINCYFHVKVNGGIIYTHRTDMIMRQRTGNKE